MTWFKIDDQAHDHRKFRGASLASVGLWALAGSWSASNRTDGFVPETVARRWPSSRRHALELVKVGLWENCEVDGERGWRFHDWADWQPTKDEYDTPTDKLRWRRKKQLERNGFLREQVHTRDRDQCRYCAVRVNWKDKRGPNGGTYDHVDPDGGNDLANVVVACRRCNGRKKDRTPVEAGMPLLAAPAPFDPETGQVPEQVGAENRSKNGGKFLEAGREQVRGKSDLPPSEQVGAGSVLNGAGSGPTNGNGHV